ncbi:hypothetical protein N7471_000915 [Penicillium samsonianum]|uniref:uncharacterized protein n=1 Tax=Penicillium samsonianum TaxID=1882272 RepID=UPI0025471F7C|nr:uncharacterized protein N7471_000915 [Penicillium samsonianum]KAJ6149716.1 hypothetical protein N7471_000915 [Penicillium samsonianum]
MKLKRRDARTTIWSGWSSSARRSSKKVAAGLPLPATAKLPRERGPRRAPENQRPAVPPAGRQLSRPPPSVSSPPPHYQQAPGRGNSRAAASHLPRRQDFRGPSHQPSGRHDSRAAELNQRDLPANTPSGPTRRGLATSRWANRQAPPQEEASRGLARSGNNSALEAPPTNADNAPAANNAPPPTRQET